MYEMGICMQRGLKERALVCAHISRIEEREREKKKYETR